MRLAADSAKRRTEHRFTPHLRVLPLSLQAAQAGSGLGVTALGLERRSGMRRFERGPLVGWVLRRGRLTTRVQVPCSTGVEGSALSGATSCRSTAEDWRNAKIGKRVSPWAPPAGVPARRGRDGRVVYRMDCCTRRGSVGSRRRIWDDGVQMWFVWKQR